MPNIQGEKTGGDVPASLYKEPYPNDAVPNVDHESTIEPPPTPEESARGAQIVRDWAAKQTTSAIPMLQEARDLGVIGMDAPENINLAQLAEREKETPAEEAIRTVPPQSLGAARTPKEMLGDMPARGGQAAYEARVKEWVGKIDATDDVADAIGRIAQEENFFPAAREGELPASHVVAVAAEAAGLDDPRDLDRAGLATRFDNDAKVRAVIQALRHTTRDFLDASEKARREPSEENTAALVEAQERQKYVQEYTMGFRGEAGRTLDTWKELLRETERTRATVKLKGDEATGAAPKGVSDLVDAVGDVQSNLAKPETEKLGLQKLVDAAENLVNAPPRAPGETSPPPAPEVKGLVDEANRTLAKLFDQIDGKKRKGDAELAKFREELAALDKGEGNLWQGDGGRPRFR